MNRYISILRGINVGGKKLIKMADLRSAFEKIGCQEVSTYIQSGNVIFTAKKIQESDLEKAIFLQLKTVFGFDIPTLVLTKDAIKKIISENPFVKNPDKDTALMHVTFLASTPAGFNIEEIEARKQDGEEYFFTDKTIYLYCPKGYADTKLNNNFFEKKLQVKATTRNWRTTKKLWEIAVSPKGGR